MGFMSEKQNRPFFNLAFAMAFWSLVGMLLVPFGKVMASTQPMPEQTGPAICPGFTLPPASPELDQFLAAQQAISEAVFPAGGANYLYCNEGIWFPDAEINELNEIQSDQDLPISGVTNGGDNFLLYPFFVTDIDILSMNLSHEQLQWAQDNHMSMSYNGGIIETSLGRTGFYGIYIAFDDGSNGRFRMMVPYDTDDIFQIFYSFYYIQQPATNKIKTCLGKAKSQFQTDVGCCAIDMNTCYKLGDNDITGAATVCVITAALVPPAGVPAMWGCIAAQGIGIWFWHRHCHIVYDGCVAKANNRYKDAKKACDTDPTPSGSGG